jgi:lipoic acid synthetase
MHKPDLKKKIRLSGLHEVKKLLRSSCLHTVCEEAMCPNIEECFSKKTATFMIMGDICTRNCKFCNVTTGKPKPLDNDEPFRVADAVNKMGLKYVVITSVTRDDLEHGGAEHFKKVIDAVRHSSALSSIEVLTPDFQGSKKGIDMVLSARPDVFNHNIETVKRLSPSIRPMADYARSLSVLKHASKSGIRTKSGLIVGLGETDNEIKETMKDLFDSGVRILTIGQYFFPPSARAMPVQKYYDEKFFNDAKEYGMALGFDYVFAGVYVRSSYMAEEVFAK